VDYHPAMRRLTHFAGTAIVGLGLFGLGGCPQDPTPPATRPATRSTLSSTTMPATLPAVAVAPVASLLDVVLRADPTFGTTRPAAIPVDVAFASRIILDEPVYLDATGQIWITHVDAEPTAKVLSRAGKSKTGTHVVRDRVLFAAWFDGQCKLVVDRDGPTLLNATSEARIDPADYDWTRAWAYNDRIVVPTARGVSVIELRDGSLTRQHVDLLFEPSGNVFVALDLRGLIAWSKPAIGDSVVARWLDGAWSTLTPDPKWPASIEHLTPMLDGTLLCIAHEEQTLEVRSILLDAVKVDEAAIEALVVKLSDVEPDVRQKAQEDLARFGTGAWPVLERLRADQPAEARVRIRALLGNQRSATLAGMTPEPGPAQVLARLNDGGVVMRFDAGVSTVDPQGVLRRVAPAFIAIRASRIERVADGVFEDFQPGSTIRVQGDEWIVHHDITGPGRWVGNHFQPLLRRGEKAFDQFVGIGTRGRWVMSTSKEPTRTLIVDPTLPDPTPRFPVWTISVGSKEAGWDKDDWPAAKRGGAWTLRDAHWAPIAPDKVDAEFISRLPADPAATQPAPILKTDDGTTFFDGLQQLTVDRPDGARLQWPLPADLTGAGVIDGRAVLISTGDRLFLFNQPGRMVRLRSTPADAEPFKVDGVFTRNIPATDIVRIWLDPAGRIAMVSDTNVLQVGFPSGQIPTSVANIMSRQALEAALKPEAEPGDQ
jgi:hypothetical protein